MTLYKTTPVEKKDLRTPFGSLRECGRLKKDASHLTVQVQRFLFFRLPLDSFKEGILEFDSHMPSAVS